MELDPFLALEHTPPSPSSAKPAAAVALDTVDPVASLLGDDHESAAPAAAMSVVIDRSSDEVEKPVAAVVKDSVAGGVNNLELAGQGALFTRCALSSFYVDA
jgi:hypothetical protein